MMRDSPLIVGAGRFAPSPTGDLHVGNFRTAILAWLWAQATNRHFLLRIEDIDRVRSGSTQRQIDDLAELGVTWDDEPLIQTSRHDVHMQILNQMLADGHVYECYCSRKDIREAASAPHVPPGHYPGTCTELTDPERESRRAQLEELGRSPALRFRPPTPTWTVHDDLYGEVTGSVDHFVVRRADGIPAYNLAVVVDDAFQGIDQVVRGDDLLSQAPAQSALASVLGFPEVTYAHVPLAVNSVGDRLAKRDGAVTLPQLKELGWSALDVLTVIVKSLRTELPAHVKSPTEAMGWLSEYFTFDRLSALPTTPWTVHNITV